MAKLNEITDKWGNKPELRIGSLIVWEEYNNHYNEGLVINCDDESVVLITEKENELGNVITETLIISREQIFRVR